MSQRRQHSSMSARKILSNTFIQIFGKVITAVLSVVVIKAITSLETIPGLGGIPAEYKLIYTYLAFFGIVADFGLFTIAVREMSSAKTEEEQQFILGNISGMLLFTITLAMALASLFIFLIPAENYTWTVKVGVAIAAITTVFTMMASTISSILQVHLKMTSATIALIIGKIIMTGYIGYVVWNFQTIPYAFYHLIFAGILGSVVTYIMTVFYTHRFFPFTFRYNIPYWRKVFKEAFPYGLAIILSTIYFKIDVLILSFFRDKSEIAIYGYPSSIVELLSILPIYFMNSTLPTLTRAFEESKEQVQKILRQAFNFLALITFPIVMGGIVLARPLMSFVMNESFLTGNVSGYYGADLAFQLLLLPTLFAFLNTLFSFTLIAAGEQSKLLKINFFGVLFNIIANLVFVPQYGFIASGVITIISELIIITLTYRECRKNIRIPFDYSSLAKITFSAVVMGGFIYLARDSVGVIPLVGIGGLIYFFCILPFIALNQEMMAIIKK